MRACELEGGEGGGRGGERGRELRGDCFKIAWIYSYRSDTINSPDYETTVECIAVCEKNLA